ncbi:MAG: SANT/Myb domain-containing protein [Holosporales bacterium]|jgi:hypothetical protein|nr:SANT/Myb domain-containing protein [Holosporales bacterium]
MKYIVAAFSFIGLFFTIELSSSQDAGDHWPRSFTQEENSRLISIVAEVGSSWETVAERMRGGLTPLQCRSHYYNCLTR